MVGLEREGVCWEGWEGCVGKEGRECRKGEKGALGRREASAGKVSRVCVCFEGLFVCWERELV